MEDRDFIDLMYQGWSKTTGAEGMFWMHELYQGQCHVIWAVDQNSDRKRIATGLTEPDAAFITAIHGCFADLTRRLHMALDEADRLDELADERTVEIADLAQKVESLEHQLSVTRGVLDAERERAEYLEETMRKMDQDLIKAQADVEYWRNEAGH